MFLFIKNPEPNCFEIQFSEFKLIFFAFFELFLELFFARLVADNDDGLKWGTYRSDTTVVFNLEIINWMPTTGGELLTDGKPLGIDATRSFPLRNDNDIVAMAVDQLGVEFYNLVYDLSDENSGGEPSFLSKFDLGGNAEQVSITDDGAYIACDDFGAYFISLESIRTGEGVAVSFAEDLNVDHISVKSIILEIFFDENLDINYFIFAFFNKCRCIYI